LFALKDFFTGFLEKGLKIWYFYLTYLILLLGGDRIRYFYFWEDFKVLKYKVNFWLFLLGILILIPTSTLAGNDDYYFNIDFAPSYPTIPAYTPSYSPDIPSPSWDIPSLNINNPSISNIPYEHSTNLYSFSNRETPQIETLIKEINVLSLNIEDNKQELQDKIIQLMHVNLYQGLRIFTNIIDVSNPYYLEIKSAIANEMLISV
jgi:hypothetical protein